VQLYSAYACCGYCWFETRLHWQRESLPAPPETSHQNQSLCSYIIHAWHSPERCSAPKATPRCTEEKNEDYYLYRGRMMHSTSSAIERSKRTPRLGRANPQAPVLQKDNNYETVWVNTPNSACTMQMPEVGSFKD